MDMKQLVILALQVSVLCTVFGFGLKATSADLLCSRMDKVNSYRLPGGVHMVVE